jgi:hypothetical protein
MLTEQEQILLVSKLFVMKIETTTKVCEAIYFDSFGIDMPVEVSNYLKNFRPIAYSNRHIQKIHSDVCGWYCLLFDYALEHKQMDDTYAEDFERFLNKWSDNTITNTKY